MTITATLGEPNHTNALFSKLDINDTSLIPVRSTERAERQLGDSELAYFLPSRETGVNDMYLHIGFHAPEYLVTRARVRAVWAILRARHPLLASKVVMRGYDDVFFEYLRRGPEDELADAEVNLDYRAMMAEEFIDLYLNGPRMLSNNRPSYLVMLTPGIDVSKQSYEVIICATHFIGDGLALHQIGNDFFSLLGSAKTNKELEADLAKEWRARCASKNPILPEALEKNYPVENRFCEAAGQIAYRLYKEKQIGGHAFPRRSAPTRHTVTRMASFDVLRTKAILQTCKVHGVSISAALFALCNIVWARMNPNKVLPTLMYSALNLRPFIPPTPDSWMLAVGYFNVILPNFIPDSAGVTSTFWARAQSAKLQSTKAARSPLVISRSRRTGRERAQAACAWGKEDDEKARGIFKAPAPQIQQAKSGPPRIPSTALVGLSLMGNLDGIYRHANFPDITLHTQTGGTRQRPGGMLIFSYSFAGKLWISLQYDENGFEKEVVENFWSNYIKGVDEFM